MPRELRRHITEPAELEALAHPLRLALIEHLMGAGPATASACARAVGDTPSNCSYHLRVLARVGLAEEAASADGRERPWQALVTGFDLPSEQSGAAPTPAEAQLLAIAVQQEQQLLREHLAARAEAPPSWRNAEIHHGYGLRLTADELRELRRGLDALIRPYIAAPRADAPEGAAVVHLALHAFRIGP